MGRSRRKKQKTADIDGSIEETNNVQIDDLPDNCLMMRIKNGTKIRNVLDYALKHYPKHKSIMWTGKGAGINKTITCTQLFKRKYPGLHQLTRLRYAQVTNEKPPTQPTNDDSTDEPKKSIKHVPEISIYLTEATTHVGRPGYQSPDDIGEFVDPEIMRTKNDTVKQHQRDNGGKITSVAAEEFAAMGLRTGQKRQRKEQQNDQPVKRNKSKGEQ